MLKGFKKIWRRSLKISLFYKRRGIRISVMFSWLPLLIFIIFIASGIGFYFEQRLLNAVRSDIGQIDKIDQNGAFRRIYLNIQIEDKVHQVSYAYKAQKFTEVVGQRVPILYTWQNGTIQLYSKDFYFSIASIFIACAAFLFYFPIMVRRFYQHIYAERRR